MWSIALETLIADRAKLFTALVGVVFSVVLVNIQGGLFLGFIGRASLLVDRGDADIWIGHKQMHNVKASIPPAPAKELPAGYTADRERAG